MTANIKPFLMFTGKAEEALNLYVENIPNSKILEIDRYDAAGPGAEGTVKTATASIDGLEIMCIDSPMPHEFTFTPSFSLFKTCADKAEFERLSELLSTDGEVLMPPGDYGFSTIFTWVNDRFGVSWQLILP